jgi:hypothetical protein
MIFLPFYIHSIVCNGLVFFWVPLEMNDGVMASQSLPISDASIGNMLL